MIDAMNEPASIARRRAREMTVISQMIAMYCAGNHGQRVREAKAHCGEALCDECKAIDDYAVTRTRRCRSMEKKTTCEECGNHCYGAAERARIREIMRWSGPRMMTKHPIAALRHVLGR